MAVDKAARIARAFGRRRLHLNVQLHEAMSKLRMYELEVAALQARLEELNGVERDLSNKEKEARDDGRV